MVQVLCYTGRGFNTCWRPANVAHREAIAHMAPDIPKDAPPGYYTCRGAVFTPIRFI